VSNRTPSETVISKVAELEDTDPPDLTPLYNSIDPEALDMIFESVQNGPDRTNGSIQFSHEGYDIVVEADGTVSVTDRGD
jgi:hypothetical protein